MRHNVLLVLCLLIKSIFKIHIFFKHEINLRIIDLLAFLFLSVFKNTLAFLQHLHQSL